MFPSPYPAPHVGPALTRARPGAEASAQLRAGPPTWGPWLEQENEGY